MSGGFSSCGGFGSWSGPCGALDCPGCHPENFVGDIYVGCLSPEERDELLSGDVDRDFDFLDNLDNVDNY